MKLAINVLPTSLGFLALGEFKTVNLKLNFYRLTLTLKINVLEFVSFSSKTNVLIFMDLGGFTSLKIYFFCMRVTYQDGRAFSIMVVGIGNGVQSLDEAGCIPLHFNALDKGMNPSVVLVIYR